MDYVLYTMIALYLIFVLRLVVTKPWRKKVSGEVKPSYICKECGNPCDNIFPGKCSTCWDGEPKGWKGGGDTNTEFNFKFK